MKILSIIKKNIISHSIKIILIINELKRLYKIKCQIERFHRQF